MVARMRRRPRERRPMVALTLITVVLLSGFWLGSRLGPPEAAGPSPDPFQYIGR